ncbi:MAG: M6 family metalloprotease domain-containing protein [Breznakibacter sp.]
MRKFTLLLFSLLVGLMVGIPVMAVPAFPGSTLFVQPDGTTVTIRLTGDENLSYVYNQEGYTLLPKDGFYFYAKHDDQGNLVPSDVVARDVNNKSAEINFLQNISKGLTFSAAQLSKRQIKRIPSGKADGLKASGIQQSTFPSTGKRKLLMILVNFSDTQLSYTQENFNDYMNQVGYNGKGSFRDFYLENSYGQLDIETTVSRWVTVSKGHDYYGRDDDENAYELLIEAINLLDDEINFKDFDNDNDGYVDGIAMIHQGQGEEYTGSDENNIWSHSWTLGSALYPANPPMKDGVYINSYTIQPEIRAGKGNTAMSTIGVMCHEFGHNLGAPDYYDTSGNGNNGTGYWDLMAAGSWNGNSGDRPAHHNAYQKSEYGWLNLKDLADNNAVVLKPVVDVPEAYKINTTTAGEFFVLENRQKKGVFDVALPGSGMIVYHVDENFIRQKYYDNAINVGWHQGLYPIVASGAMSNPNTSACPFPGSKAVTSFTDYTSPATLSWSGERTLRPITNIAQSGGNITFSVATIVPNCVTPVGMQVTYQGLNKVYLKWSAGENPFYYKYNVYRDGVLVAAAITALEYNDLSAPAGVSSYAVTNVSDDGTRESNQLVKRVFCATADAYQAYDQAVSVDLANVTLSWKSPVKLYDSFEEMTPFVLDPAGVNDWSYIDGDSDATCGFGVSYFNNGAAKSFICFNPSLTDPVMTDPYVQPLNGAHYMASFSAVSFMTTTDDWLISKELELTKAHRLIFYAKGYLDRYGKEEVNVGISKTGKESSDFVFINSAPIELNSVWTRYEFTIPADTKHFTIHCQSTDIFVTMVDELSLLAIEGGDAMNVVNADVYPTSQITGFNVYRNGLLLRSNIQDLTVTDVVPVRGSYEYTIESLVGSEKIPMARVTVPVFIKETAVETPLVAQNGVVLFPNPAKGQFSVRCDGQQLESVEIYNIAGNLVISSSRSNEINIAALPVGYYIVKVKTDQGRFVKRLQVK